MSTPSNPMTTENGVRVPREALEFWERMLADGSTTTSSGLPVTVLEMIDVNQAIASEMRKHLAAPAPAGSLPEQGAGLQTLADEWAHAIRNGVMDDGEGDGPMFYATEEWALNMLESIRALARQQSRVVDREMSGRLGDHLREKHGVMLSTQSLQAALRAALEGDRDGR